MISQNDKMQILQNLYFVVTSEVSMRIYVIWNIILVC